MSRKHFISLSMCLFVSPPFLKNIYSRFRPIANITDQDIHKSRLFMLSFEWTCQVKSSAAENYFCVVFMMNWACAFIASIFDS